MSIFREAYYNQWLTRIWAYLGGVGVVLGLVQIVAEDGLEAMRWWLFALIVPSVVIAAFVGSIPRRSVAFRFAHGGWEIELIRGDLLEQACPIVVTVDRQISTALADVGARSLVAQVSSRWFASPEELAEQVPPRSADLSVYEVGTLIPISAKTGPGSGWLFCLARKIPGGSHVSLRELLAGHAALWDGLRGFRENRVAIPVIGSGFAGSSMSTRALLMFLLLSFHGASIEGRVVNRLRVVIHEAHFDPRMFRAAEQALGELGYVRVRP